jgi:hypothetical protein
MFSGDVNASEAAVEVEIPVASTISDFRVRLNGSPGAGNSYTFIVRQNGADTAVTCAITDAAISCADTVNTVAFAVGDRISIRSIPASSPTARTMTWSAVRSP